ncbi:MAG: motif [Pseudomonadota bacterium]
MLKRIVGPAMRPSLVVAVLALMSAAHAQVDVVTNGSFESGLSAWTFGAAHSGGNPACSANAAVAGGTETLTGAVAYAPTAGTQVAMLGAKSSGLAGFVVSSRCVLYQDVAIPAGAKTGRLNLKWAAKFASAPDADPGKQKKYRSVALYSTDGVPRFETDLGGAGTGWYTETEDAALVSDGLDIDVPRFAGTTVRLGIWTDVRDQPNGGAVVLGVDEVKFLVNAPLSISSRFEPAVIDEGGNTTIIYTLTNPTSLNATGIRFTGQLEASLGAPLGVQSSCGGTAEMHINGYHTFGGGQLAAGQSCTISFPVTASVARIIPGGRLPRVVANIGVLEPQWPNGGGTELTVRALATPASPPPAVPASPPPGTPQPVPTLGEWGMIGLAVLLALLGARRLRRV